MHCELGDQATAILKFDRQSGTGTVTRYVLVFEGVLHFEYVHDAADDGIIFSCAVSLTTEGVCFACNPEHGKPVPVVRARSFEYTVSG